MSEKTFKIIRGWSIFFFIALAIAIFVFFILLAIRELRNIFFLWGALIPFVIIVCLLNISPAITRRFYSNYYDRFPELTTQATVISKTTDTSGGGSYSAGYGYLNTPVSTEHYVSFALNRRRENFLVDVSFYNMLRENDAGLLTYKEINGDFLLIDFVPDKSL